MSFVAGIDVGSTYTKAVLLDDEGRVAGRALRRTGFRLGEAAEAALGDALAAASQERAAVAYVVATGFGRHQVALRDTQVTDLTAGARGARHLFPATRTLLDIGGQTMKASRIDERARVLSFRLNDKCAAGTGAFLEKTARYLGFETHEIGPLAATSKSVVPISGVCAVFAESEVINHLSQGSAPADIMHGAMMSLTERCLQLLRRLRPEPEFTLAGGILRFPTMVLELRRALGDAVNVPSGDLVQFVNALGAALLARQRCIRLVSRL
ncbi:MAG: acyl-CoA dehydratase activase [Planctomycetaceae bacterium]